MNYAAEIDRAIEGEQLASALTLAEQWLVDAPEEADAWSKLGHVHEMREDFMEARSAVSVALKISPDYPPYLFKHGYIEYRLGNYADAANFFGRCVARSEIIQDGYYLDAARIAQARCLWLDGRGQLAVSVVAVAATTAATWLEQRFTKDDVIRAISGSGPALDLG